MLDAGGEESLGKKLHLPSYYIVERRAEEGGLMRAMSKRKDGDRNTPILARTVYLSRR